VSLTCTVSFDGGFCLNRDGLDFWDDGRMKENDYQFLFPVTIFSTGLFLCNTVPVHALEKAE